MDDATRLPPQPLPQPATFRALLTPNRSLSQSGFLVLMAALAAISLISGLLFVSIGAWPVMVFFGLDVLLVFAAFRMNYRDGKAYELVELQPDVLTITRMSAKGRRQSFDFNPHWVRLDLTEEANGRSELKLRSRGEVLEIAGCLSDDERRSFASALQKALIDARGGPRI